MNKNVWKRMLGLLVVLQMVLALSVPVFAVEGEDPDEVVGPPQMVLVNGPVFEASAGTTNEIVLRLRNNSSYGASSVVIQPVITEVADNPFKIEFKNNGNKIASVSSRAEASTTMLLTVDKAATSKTYSITLNYTYYNKKSEKFTSSDTMYVKIVNKDSAPNFALEEFKVEPGIIEAGGSGKIGATIRNIGPLDMYEVVVTLKGLTPEGMGVSGINTKKYNSIIAGTRESFSFDIVANGEMASGNYPVIIRLDYTDYAGKAYELEQEVYINVEGSTGGGGVSAASKPKIIVSDYSCDPRIVMAGEEFNLSMTFLNTHPEKDVKNVKMYLTMVEETSSESTKTGNIFTPVDSSNTFYFDEIKSKSTASKTLRLYTMPDAQPKTYTIRVNFEYEDAKGNEFTATELLGVNVKQPTEISVGDVFVPEMMESGMPVNVSFELYNTGKVEVSNLMITIEGDVTATAKSTYLGNFASGETQYYDGSFYATEEGPAKVNIIVSYDDPSGEKIQIPHEFTMQITAPSMPEEGMDGMDPMMPPPSQGPSKKLIIGIVVGAIIVLIIIIVAVKKHKAKAESKFLEAMDEEEAADSTTTKGKDTDERI